jgi:hypothetical protein
MKKYFPILFLMLSGASYSYEINGDCNPDPLHPSCVLRNGLGITANCNVTTTTGFYSIDKGTIEAKTSDIILLKQGEYFNVNGTTTPPGMLFRYINVKGTCFGIK